MAPNFPPNHGGTLPARPPNPVAALPAQVVIYPVNRVGTCNRCYMRRKLVVARETTIVGAGNRTCEFCAGCAAALLGGRYG